MIGMINVLSFVCFGFLIFIALRLMRRMRKIEARDWPMRVVRWNRVPDLPNCRCVMGIDDKNVDDTEIDRSA